MDETCDEETEVGICGQPAVARMFWPLHPPQLVCADHLKKAESIAACMGFYLLVEEIPANP